VCHSSGRTIDESLGLIEHAVVGGVSDLVKRSCLCRSDEKAQPASIKGRVCDGLPMSFQNLSHKIGTGQILSPEAAARSASSLLGWHRRGSASWVLLTYQMNYREAFPAE
jgi:hypothetical protein